MSAASAAALRIVRPRLTRASSALPVLLPASSLFAGAAAVPCCPRADAFATLRRGHTRAHSTSAAEAEAAAAAAARRGRAQLPPTLRELLRAYGDAAAQKSSSNRSSEDSGGGGGGGGGGAQAHAQVQVHAWIRSVRSHRKVSFLTLTDGTLPGDEVLQAVVPTELLLAAAGGATDSGSGSAGGNGLSAGSAVRLAGMLVPSRGSGQAVELKVDSLEVLGRCDAATYPLAMPQQLTPETVRRLAHMRARTLRFAATLRSRHALLRGLEGWFDNHDFLRVTTPIMTSSDCEGAGEVFQVLADSDAAQVFAGQLSREGQESSGPTSPTQLSKDLTAFFSHTATYLTVSSQLHLEAITALAHPRTYTIAPAFRAEGSATSRHLSEFWMCEAEVAWIDNGIGTSGGEDASSEPARALEQTMEVCEQAVKGALRAALGLAEASERAARDADFLHQSSHHNERSEEGAIVEGAEVQDLRHYAAEDTAPWPRITYTRAIELLQERHQRGSASGAGPFSIEPVWGQGLASEHERWLASEEGPWGARSDAGQARRRGGPVFVTDFPSSVKAFYMRVNSGRAGSVAAAAAAAQGEGTEGEEERTVACFDLLVPRVGELAGGSVREEREDVLRERMREFGLGHTGEGHLSHATHHGDDHSGQQSGASHQQHHPVAPRSLDWYARDLRRYGGAPHGGFGIGIERLVSWATGTESVRDCIPFPRTTGAVRF
ncbi:asparaginyl-tRNA synthetase [Tilletia horrida]|nr:asparaginyl-tRNA synthetase [Tilletia horrida]